MEKAKIMKNPIRTLSGVAPIAVMIPPKKCSHGTCTYCPSLNVPQSYTPESPAVRRARSLNYNPEKQVKRRLEQLKEMNHPTDKIELIIMGGTFLSYNEKFQFEFIKKCYDALNNKKSLSLEQSKKINEKAKNRCVALCIETRPDFCSEKHIKNMLKFGCTRVELGVQAIDNKIYKIINRGHKVKDVIEATQRLKKYGFKVGYHIMPGLPSSSPKKDIKMLKEIFQNENFRPDQLKIYPAQVLKGAHLVESFNRKEYVPYSTEDAKSLLLKIMPLIPRYCRVMRIMREIPRQYLIAGVSNMALRHEIEKELEKNNIKLNEIRSREIGHVIQKNKDMKISNEIKINKIEYNSSKGKEIFLEAINKQDILFGLLRLRFEKDKNSQALIRELHIYGPAAKLNENNKNKIQHNGIGKSLLKKAESISKKHGFKKIKIISGVGVRQYYKNLGYNLDEEGYMARLI